MRILIVEEGLKTGSGHWPVYIGGIAKELRKAGDEVDVLVHAGATDQVVEAVGGVRWLKKSCWTDKDCQGFRGGLKHSRIFSKDLIKWISLNEPYDFVLLLTMRLQHLVALLFLSLPCFQGNQVCKKLRNMRILALFVQGFGEYVEGVVADKYRRIPARCRGILRMLLASGGKHFGFYGASAYPCRGGAIMAWICFRILRRSVKKGSLILAAETSQMQKKLEYFAKCPVALFPHPVVSFSANSSSADADCHQKTATNSGLSTEDSEKPFVIVCPGFARYEKGSDLLLDAIDEIIQERIQVRVPKKSPKNVPLHFIMQWAEPFVLPNGKWVGTQNEFKNRALAFKTGIYHSGSGELVDTKVTVEMLNKNLNQSEYEQLLNRADYVLLPYRKDSYHNRVSRVAIEASLKGVKLIFTSGTWNQEVAELCGFGIKIPKETASAIKDSIFQALETSGVLPIGGRIRTAEYHSVLRFRRVLLESTNLEWRERGFSRVKVCAQKIVLRGWYGETNLGDDLLLFTILNALPSSLNILVTGREVGLRKLQITGEGVKFGGIEKLFGHFRQIVCSDDYVIGGGGLFPELSTSPLKYLQLLMAIFLRKRLIILGIGINPNKGRIESRIWGFLLKHATVLTVRDSQSKRFLDRCKSNGKSALLFADLVFSGFPQNTPRKFRQDLLPKRYALICPAWFDSIGSSNAAKRNKRMHLLAKEFNSAARAIMDFGFTPVVFSFFPRQDLPLIREIEKISHANTFHFLEYGKDFLVGDALDIFKASDFCLCMRFHSLVLALISRRNFAAVNYDFKTSCLLDSIGLSDAGIDFGVGQDLCFGYEGDLPEGDLSKLVMRRLRLEKETKQILESEVPNLELAACQNLEILKGLYTPSE